jgi:hypothetical protein
MHYTVYKITNNINQKEYVGVHSTYNPNDNYMGSGERIKKAIKKYGKENFSKDIIFYAVSKDIMYWIERMIVDVDYVNDENTYNMTIGGLGRTIDYTYKDSSKTKISNTLKQGYATGRIVPTKPNKGKKMTQMQKEKISTTLKERYKFQEHPTKGEKNGMFGRPSANKGMPAWNKGLTIEKEKCEHCCGYYTKNHISKCSLNQEYKKNKIGQTCDIIKICIHCDKMFYNSNGRGFSNYLRWHGDNCKHK